MKQRQMLQHQLIGILLFLFIECPFGLFRAATFANHQNNQHNWQQNQSQDDPVNINKGSLVTRQVARAKTQMFGAIVPQIEFRPVNGPI